MSAAETEAAAIVASEEFLASPSSVLNSYATRAATAHAFVQWHGGADARRSCIHLVRVACLLAQAAGLERGHALEGLVKTYGDPLT